MKMKFNRITMSLISALFVFALIACELQVPQSVRVKSNPGLYLSLGSPFAGSDESLSLNDYLSEEELEKQLGGESGDIDLLPWDEYDEDVRAYRVRYPVADINVDLSQYVADMDAASNVSGASQGWIPGTGSEIDIPLPLDSMSFVYNVTNVTISVTLNFQQGYTAPAAGETGTDTVPDGVSVTFKGAVFSDTAPSTPTGNKWASSEIATFSPATNIISMGVTVPAGYWFSPSLEFDWEEAKVNIGEEGEGSYELDFTSFSSFMGEGVSFKEITGYMYIENPTSSTIAVTLTWKKSTGDNDVDIDEISEALTNWETGFTVSTDPDKKIDLKDLFTYPLEFSYDLSDVTLKKVDNKTGKISVDMVILLPLEFTLASSLQSNTFTGYKKLNIEALRDLSSGGGGDLFGRTGSEPSEDDIFSDLDGVTIKFDNAKGIPEGLAFGVKYGSKTAILEINNNPSIKLETEDIGYPFSPSFELLVEDGKNLKILKGEEDIDFNIAVEAQTDLDYQVKF